MSNPKHFPYAELVGRAALSMYPDTIAVLTVIVRPTGALVLGGPTPGASETAARQGLTYGLRQALADLERAVATTPKGRPLIIVPGGSS